MSYSLSPEHQALVDIAIALFPDRPGIADQVARFADQGEEEGYTLAERYLAAQQQVLIENRFSAYVDLSHLDFPHPNRNLSAVPTAAVLQIVAETPGVKVGQLRSRCEVLGIHCNRNQIARKIKHLRKHGFLNYERSGRAYLYSLTECGQQLLANEVAA